MNPVVEILLAIVAGIVGVKVVDHFTTPSGPVPGAYAVSGEGDDPMLDPRTAASARRSAQGAAQLRTLRGQQQHAQRTLGATRRQAGAQVASQMQAQQQADDDAAAAQQQADADAAEQARLDADAERQIAIAQAQAGGVYERDDYGEGYYS